MGNEAEAPMLAGYVILLRADKQWAPIIIEELQAQGIPAYAELSSGYFGCNGSRNDALLASHHR